MKLSNLKPAAGSRKKKVRVGRGEGSGAGKTSGKGGKGQTARAGGKIRAGFEGGQMPLYRRLPKLGFVSRKSVLGLNRFTVVNLSDLEKFDAGTTIEAAMFRHRGSRRAGLKVLGTGNLTKKLTLKVQAISESAKAKIEAVGGTVEIVRP